MFAKTIAAHVAGVLLTGLTAASFGADVGLPPRGAITLSFDDSAQNFVRYVDADATPAVGLTEFFEEGRRQDDGKPIFLSGPTILSFTPGSDCSAVGFTEQKDWLGCFKKGGIGTGRLTNGQSLTIGIDPTGPAAGTTATSWTLGLTAKQNVTAEIVLSIDGAATQTLYLYTGLSAEGITPGGNVFTCAEGPDSNPDSDTFCEISNQGDQPFKSAEIRVTNDGALSIGSGTTTLNLSAVTGILTCEEDNLSGSPTTTVEDIFLVDDAFAGAVQCRRLPNRSGAACQPVPYLLEASCDAASGECALDFIHGDQPDTSIGGDPTQPLPREDYAFLCEVWWPERPGGGVDPDTGLPAPTSAGQFVNPVLPKTDIFWGGDGSPGSAVLGDAPVDYCQGITPVFNADLEPNASTICGDSLSYLLSEPGNPDVSGGLVRPESSQCSLLEAYDDVLIRNGFPDQCTAAGCPAGDQIACLIDSRTSQVQDKTAIPVPGDPGGTLSIPTSLFKSYELIYIQGDLRMRRF
jgi:hypothetical protein